MPSLTLSRPGQWYSIALILIISGNLLYIVGTNVNLSRWLHLTFSISGLFLQDSGILLIQITIIAYFIQNIKKPMFQILFLGSFFILNQLLNLFILIIPSWLYSATFLPMNPMLVINLFNIFLAIIMGSWGIYAFHNKRKQTLSFEEPGSITFKIENGRSSSINLVKNLMSSKLYWVFILAGITYMVGINQFEGLKSSYLYFYLDDLYSISIGLMIGSVLAILGNILGVVLYFILNRNSGSKTNVYIYFGGIVGCILFMGALRLLLFSSNVIFVHVIFGIIALLSGMLFIFFMLDFTFIINSVIQIHPSYTEGQLLFPIVLLNQFFNIILFPLTLLNENRIFLRFLGVPLFCLLLSVISVFFIRKEFPIENTGNEAQF